MHGDGERMIRELNPGGESGVRLQVSGDAKAATAGDFCNLHGLWKGEI